MCTSPLPVPPVLLDDDDAYLMDKELILFLGERRVGDPIPPDVITEVNPFSIEPWDCSEEMWFLYNPEEAQSRSKGSIIEVTSNGYWKFMDDLRISTDTSTVGRKTTREFYIGQAPLGYRTGWMMHEYQVEKMVVQGNSKTQDTNSFCRLFYPEHCGPVSPQPSDPMDVESTLLRILEEEDIIFSQNAANSSQVGGKGEKRRSESSVGHSQDLVPPQDLANGYSMEDMQAICDFSKGDFLELKDLYDPESSSTSSDNSSLISMNSDDYFDAEALLREIENESSLNLEEDRVDYRFNISTSVRSPPSGSAYRNNNNLVVRDRGSANPIIALSSSTMQLQGDGDASVSGLSEGSQVNVTDSRSSQEHISPPGSGQSLFVGLQSMGRATAVSDI